MLLICNEMTTVAWIAVKMYIKNIQNNAILQKFRKKVNSSVTAEIDATIMFSLK